MTSFLGAELPPGFDLRAVPICAGEELAYTALDWTSALVVVECGEIDVEGRCGSRIRFVSGDMLWLADLPVRALYNPGPEDVMLSVVTRVGSELR
jgi:hypothetical protein